jgi:hypothetical protein
MADVPFAGFLMRPIREDERIRLADTVPANWGSPVPERGTSRTGASGPGET